MTRLVDGVATSLTENGFPLWRLGVSAPALDPLASSASVQWVRGQGTSLELIGHGAAYRAAFLDSPINALLQGNERFGHWRLDTPGPYEAFPMLRHLRSLGCTDYVLHMVEFTPGTALRGVALSFATHVETGFTDEHLAFLADLVPTLGLALCKLLLERTLRQTLGTYLGSATGAHVLDGQITRGEGRTVSAAILLVDLRGFTALTDRVDPLLVVGWLDEQFEAMGDPVAQLGGEILKFLGDGFLAIFPIAEPDARPCLVCASALQAAKDARSASEALNARRIDNALPSLHADFVLHFGEVIYGNVGTSRRLDFTVIGRAVNEASRIEKRCGELDRTLLISDSFAARCSTPLTSLGMMPLRGLDLPQRIWCLPEP